MATGNSITQYNLDGRPVTKDKPNETASDPQNVLKDTIIVDHHSDGTTISPEAHSLMFSTGISESEQATKYAESYMLAKPTLLQISMFGSGVDGAFSNPKNRLPPTFAFSYSTLGKYSGRGGFHAASPGLRSSGAAPYIDMKSIRIHSYKGVQLGLNGVLHNASLVEKIGSAGKVAGIVSDGISVYKAKAYSDAAEEADSSEMPLLAEYFRIEAQSSIVNLAASKAAGQIGHICAVATSETVIGAFVCEASATYIQDKVGDSAENSYKQSEHSYMPMSIEQAKRAAPPIQRAAKKVYLERRAAAIGNGTKKEINKFLELQERHKKGGVSVGIGDSGGSTMIVPKSVINVGIGDSSSSDMHSTGSNEPVDWE